MSTDVIAIVVTYNRIELLKENLRALKNSRYPIDLLVIDNHSTDGTSTYLQETNIDNILMETNEGGAGGFSRGIEEGVKRGYKYLWIMDDDTIPYADSVKELVNAAHHLENRFGFLASYVEWTDNSPCIMNLPELVCGSNEEEVKLASEGIIKCTRASFVSMLINAEAVKKIGLPIKEFFIWGDDTEYSGRLSESFPCYFIPKSVVLHKMKSNVPTDIVSDNDSRLDRYKILYRNQTYLARIKGKKEAQINSLRIFYQIVKVLKSPNGNKFKKIKIILKGWKDGKNFHPEIHYMQSKDIN